MQILGGGDIEGFEFVRKKATGSWSRLKEEREGGDGAGLC